MQLTCAHSALASQNMSDWCGKVALVGQSRGGAAHLCPRCIVCLTPMLMSPSRGVVVGWLVWWCDTAVVLSYASMQSRDHTRDGATQLLQIRTYVDIHICHSITYVTHIISIHVPLIAETYHWVLHSLLSRCALSELIGEILKN